MDEISVTEFKATCLKLIEKVRMTGCSYLILKNGKPAAVLTAPQAQQAQNVVAGLLANRAKELGDIVASISPESEWEIGS